MVTAAGASYQYNALGQRVSKRVNGTTAYYTYSPNGSLLSENTNKQYIYLHGQIIGYIRNNQLYFVHNDHLGRPEVITNKYDSIVWRATLGAFDRTVTTTSIGDFNIGFPGQYWDSEKGSYYNMFRDYDPETGRYLQSDPIGLAGGMNTYAYVGGNPLSRIDPLGLDFNVCSYGMHIGIGVNSTNTMGRRPANGITKDALLSKDVAGEVSADSGSKSCSKIKTTAAQDKAMQSYINQNVLNPGVYNLLGRSCVGFVRDGLSQVLGMQLSNTTLPSALYSEVSGFSPAIVSRGSKGLF
ncbi:MAG: hypothetical protein HRU22_07290 [Gammaproteobacteria bacterium]|nr:hypothetical protein [Gammaproteobacteria bacterium]